MYLLANALLQSPSPLLYGSILGVCRFFHYKKQTTQKSRSSFLREIFICLMAVYLIMLYRMTLPLSSFAPDNLSIGLANANFIPFDEIGPVLQDLKAGVINWDTNFWGNIALFLPFGFLFPAVFPKCRFLGLTILLGFLTSVTIETVQLFILRGTDIDDVILNTLGTFIGYLFFRICFQKRCNRHL